MRFAELKKEEDGTLVPRCYVAQSFFARLRGLLGKRGLPDDEAVLFPRCNSIHTFFMRFPIDVILVSKDGKVVDVVEAMAPWRFLPPRKGVKHVIEMRARRSQELGIGTGVQLFYPGVLG